jgi:predicted membrane protein
MLIGGFFLLPKLDIEGLDFVAQNGWAIGLVIGGVLIICKTIRGRNFCHRNPEEFRVEMERRREWHKERHSRKRENHRNESGYIERNCIFCGNKEKLDIKNFKGGEINSIFGGIELDLSDAELAEGVHHLELNSIFGGIVLYVPIEWNIEIRQDQVFGQFVDKRPKPGFEVDENSLLILEASSIFGGGEIKCR